MQVTGVNHQGRQCRVWQTHPGFRLCGAVSSVDKLFYLLLSVEPTDIAYFLHLFLSVGVTNFFVKFVVKCQSGVTDGAVHGYLRDADFRLHGAISSLDKLFCLLLSVKMTGSALSQLSFWSIAATYFCEMLYAVVLQMELCMTDWDYYPGFRLHGAINTLDKLFYLLLSVALTDSTRSQTHFIMVCWTVFHLVTSVYMYLQDRMQIYIHVHTYTNTHTQTCAHVRAHTYTHAHARASQTDIHTH